MMCVQHGGKPQPTNGFINFGVVSMIVLLVGIVSIVVTLMPVYINHYKFVEASKDALSAIEYGNSERDIYGLIDKNLYVNEVHDITPNFYTVEISGDAVVVVYDYEEIRSLFSNVSILIHFTGEIHQ